MTNFGAAILATLVVLTSRTGQASTETANIQKIKGKLSTIKTIKVMQDGAFKPLKMDIKAEATGTIAGNEGVVSTAAACTNAGAAVASASNGVAITALTLDKTAYEPTTINLGKAGPEDAACIDADGEENPYLVTQKQLANAICTARNSNPTTTKTIEQTTTQELIADPDMQAIALLLTGTTTNTQPTDKQETDAVKKLFGEGTKSIQETHLASLSSGEKKINIGSSKETKTLADFAKSELAGQAIGFFLARAAKQDEQTRGATESEQPKPPCDGKKGDDCKGDCVLVDRVCKPAEKGEGENKETKGNDAKTTNTTGSNSFLINRAPLFL
uniref:Variant surface glycoprotein 1125.5337 n=1 Tax=Trypanosoma brucei TaxID=5691 RepID=A0A1J0RBX1_9TRYP|nr:variant surface glycoprotein 1125.5337 [Trypanosoma brucei]